LASALSEAADRSICGDAIVESFVSKSGPQIGGEAYVYDGELEMLCLGEQQVAKSVGNPHLPVGMIFPARLSDQIYSDIRQGLQRIINKLGYQFGAMNLEIMIDEEDQIHLMEIGPRSGGNMLPELMQHTEGVNVAKWSVEHSVGESISLSKTESSCKNVYAYYALHSVENGKLSKIVKENKIEKNIFREELFINRGQNVKAFSSSGDVVGILFASFDEYDECVRFFKNDQAYLEVVLK
jgi:hypothetical protein